MGFSIIHPSRNRPDKSRETFKKWFERADSNDYQWITSLDQDDPTLKHYDYVNPLISNNRSCVDAINNAAKIAIGNIFIVVSDDTDCPNGWDSKLKNEIGNKSDFLLKVDDGIQNYICTMTVMDRTYFQRDNYIYHPEIKHQFADTYLTCVADIRGRLIHSKLKFYHNHYSVNGTEPDELHKRNDATFWLW